jgi:hypothetical protein
MILVYLFQDIKILVVSSSLSHISLTLVALAHLFMPLRSDDFFLPFEILNTKTLPILKTLGPGLLGLHSSLLGEVKALNVRRCVFLNADMVYLMPLGVDPPLAEAQAVVCRFHEDVLGSVVMGSPGFPVHLLSITLRHFFRQLLGPCLEPEAALDPFEASVAGGKLAGIAAGMLEGGGSRCEVVRSVLREAHPESEVPRVGRFAWSATMWVMPAVAPRQRGEQGSVGSVKVKDLILKRSSAGKSLK